MKQCIKLINKLIPDIFSNEQSFNLGQGSVYESRSFVEHAFVGTNDDWFHELKAVSFLIVYFVANNKLSILYECYFIKFIKFIGQNCSSLLTSWFKTHKYSWHEISILLILPCIVNPTLAHKRSFLVDSEEFRKL